MTTLNTLKEIPGIPAFTERRPLTLFQRKTKRRPKANLFFAGLPHFETNPQRAWQNSRAPRLPSKNRRHAELGSGALQLAARGDGHAREVWHPATPAAWPGTALHVWYVCIDCIDCTDDSVAFCSPAKSLTFSGLMENPCLAKS